MLVEDDYKVITRLEEPKDLALKQLDALRRTFNIAQIACLVSASPRNVWNWLHRVRPPARITRRCIELVSNLTLAQQRALLTPRPGARYVDRTKRKKVQKLAPVEDYAI